METLDKHFRALTKAAFEKHGFQSADLLSHWADIVGADTAALCTPERITWTRPKEKGQTPVGTLTLKSAPGRALDIQYKADAIRERLNTYLGYTGIARIRVQPGEMSGQSAPAPAAAGPAESPGGIELPPLEDEALKQALTRLKQGILSEKSRSPQGQ